jgi:hypothetical protein
MGEMTDQHEDPKFEQWLKERAKSYHSPRPTPRDEIWNRIQDARRNKHVIELRPWMRWVVAAAAVLVLGIGIGRWTANQSHVAGSDSATGTPVAREIDSLANQAYQVAATQYLSRTTQLMLDSPAARDPRLNSLLQDLELVLMQIAVLNPLHDGRDRDLITQGMNQSNVLPKLRSAIPAGPVPVRTEGAL